MTANYIGFDQPEIDTSRVGAWRIDDGEKFTGYYDTKEQAYQLAKALGGHRIAQMVEANGEMTYRGHRLIDTN